MDCSGTKRQQENSESSERQGQGQKKNVRGGHRGRAERAQQPKGQDRLNIMYLNSQSIVNKIEELCTTTSDLKPDIICICESWCHPDINNSFLSIPGYKLIEELRKDRSDTARGIGGGLLVYVRDGLTVFTNSDDNSDFIQYCKFQVKLKSDILNACLIYRSPNSSHDNNDELNKLLYS